MSEIKYSLNDGILCIDNEVVELPWPVVQVLSCQSLLIVRVQSEFKKIYNRNIFAFLASAKLKWQIPECPHGGTSSKPYMRVYLAEDGELAVGNWIGVDYFVSLVDGSLTTKSFNR
ncbi:MAG: hypothetical protein L3K26_08730 [Candidatus Hydrogenedentes bacterium]|nr:hypothetical protein [Candidatus Hydrogenedentota bacterium]